jgi:hypothetical protein
MSRKENVYEAVRRLKGRVPDQATWRRIVQVAGYTAYRDAAGFYGGRYPSMLRNADGSRSLTAAGWRRAA